MENFKNIASTILVSAGAAISFIETYTLYARAIAATLAIIVALVTLYRNYKNNGK